MSNWEDYIETYKDYSGNSEFDKEEFLIYSSSKYSCTLRDLFAKELVLNNEFYTDIEYEEGDLDTVLGNDYIPNVCIWTAQYVYRNVYVNSRINNFVISAKRNYVVSREDD